MYRQFGKRLFDLVIAVPVLLTIFPVCIFIYVLVFLKLGSPALFKQKRPGWHNQIFTLLKFRTMSDDLDSKGNLLPDSRRQTRFGKLLRSASLDELPELWNVICGDMSLVGPRPLLVEYLDRYSPEQARRHEAKPGITGWAQVNGRNAITWDQKFSLDVWYVDHLSFWLDAKIIVITIWKILKREGISQSGQVTMSEFMGTQNSVHLGGEILPATITDRR